MSVAEVTCPLTLREKKGRPEMPFMVQYMPCPECGRLGPIEPPHKDPHSGEEVIEFKCPVDRNHRWAQKRRITGFDPPRDCEVPIHTHRGKSLVTTQKREAVLRLYDLGVEVQEICALLKTSCTTIYRVVRASGRAPRRTGAGRPRKAVTGLRTGPSALSPSGVSPPA